jgi:hypothetical protein
MALGEGRRAKWGLNRRREPRARVRLQLFEVPGSPLTFCRARDLSAGGMYVDLGLPQPPGTRCKVRFSPGDSRGDLVVTCEVVSGEPESDRFGTHLKFVDLSEEDRRRLRRAVAHLQVLAAADSALIA